MNIGDILDPSSIEVYLKSSTKASVLNELIELLAKSSKSQNEAFNFEEIKQSILDREELSSTGICNGLAIPHAKVAGINRIMASIGLSKEGIDFDSMDKLKSTIFFILLSPKEDNGNHVKILAKITRILKDANSRKELLECSNTEEVMDFIRKKEKERY